MEVVFQVNGKVRAREKVSVSLDKETLENMAINHERVKNILGKTIVTIVVPGKLVNFVGKCHAFGMAFSFYRNFLSQCFLECKKANRNCGILLD